jgi:hypothetical protein
VTPQRFETAKIIMNEIENKKSRRHLPRALWTWLICFVAMAGYIVFLDIDAIRHSGGMPPYWGQFLIAATPGSLLLGLWYFIRWSCNHRNVGRLLIGSAVLATLAAIFYLEEDWRGQRAWEKCKGELEAKSVVLDWDKYIPPPVPDDQNFFKAPKMEDWFQRGAPEITQTPTTLIFGPGTNQLARDLDLSKFMALHQPPKTPVTVAELVIEPRAANAGETNVLLRFDDPAGRDRAKELIQNATGPNANGAQGFYFIAKPLNQIQPAHIVLQADQLPSLEEVAALFPADTISANVGNLRVEHGVQANSFRILLVPHPVYSADEFLQWSDRAVPDFDLIREALKRPCARMDTRVARTMLLPARPAGQGFARNDTAS